MTVYVFTGPTLSAQEAHAELDAVYLPPVSQGDVYRAALKQPVAIGIIDGYFERVPAVWHKEILWAMSQGIHVYGSASMGALRAAELEQFGMEGVGAIFEAYRDGALEDDDEVAVVHGSSEHGYRVMSEAMVNIRCTLADAEAAGVIHPDTCAALVRIAKGLFYPERVYPLILDCAAQDGLPLEELGEFREWLHQGQVNQKREDALAMLRVMREHLAASPEPKRVLYSFEHTDMWDHAQQLAGELHLDSAGRAETILIDALVDELRLEGNGYAGARRAAMGRLLAVDEARRQGVTVNPEKLEETADAFRRERGLVESGDVKRWLEEHHLNHEQFTRLIEEEARLRWIETVTEREVMNGLPDYLRVSGEYTRLLARARDKQRTLESWGLQNPALADAGLTEEELLRWYFEEDLGRPVVTDVASHARSVGFADEDAFRRAVLREFCYSLRKN